MKSQKWTGLFRGLAALAAYPYTIADLKANNDES